MEYFLCLRWRVEGGWPVAQMGIRGCQPVGELSEIRTILEDTPQVYFDVTKYFLRVF